MDSVIAVVVALVVLISSILYVANYFLNKDEWRLKQQERYDYPMGIPQFHFDE